MAILTGNKKAKLYIGERKVRKAYVGNKRVYSAGNICTYHVDGVTYQEEVDEGESCLAPKTFTPSKSGWTFVGWRQDTTANGSVLAALAMGDVTIVLYAVFRQTITLSYAGNGNTGGSMAAQTGTRYWNTGNVSNPSFTLQVNGFTRSGYTFSKWALGSAGGTQFGAGVSITLSANATMYAVWIGSPHQFTPLNSVTWTESRPAGNPGDYTFSPTADKILVGAKKTGGNNAIGVLTADVPTGGCTKVDISFYARYGYGNTINEVALNPNTDYADGMLTFDCSSGYINIRLKAAEGTAYWKAEAAITKIYFHN